MLAALHCVRCMVGTHMWQRSYEFLTDLIVPSRLQLMYLSIPGVQYTFVTLSLWYVAGSFLDLKSCSTNHT